MAPFEEVVVALLVVVKVDRQNMSALLVEEQTYLLLIVVVLLQVIVNQQPTPTTTTTTETPSQTDITVAPTTTQEEQQQDTSSDDNGGDKSTSTEDQNQIPVANAGPSLTVKPTANVALDGTKSYDPNGDNLQFLWLQLAGGPTVSLLNNATATPSFIAPSVPNTTTLTFQLIVSDGQTDSTPAYTYAMVQP